jgi:hypothetical protein
MLYVHEIEESAQSGRPALVIHEVKDSVVSTAPWRDAEPLPTEEQTGAVADVMTWVYPGGRVAQYQRGRGWRDLA